MMEKLGLFKMLKTRYTIPVFLGFLFLFFSLITLPDYGINWDEPFHFLRGQAYAQLFSTGKKTYDQPPRLSPVLIRPGEFISRYDFQAWEENKEFVKLPDNPKPQAEFVDIQKNTTDRRSFYEHEAWNGRYFMNSDGSGGPGHPPFVDIVSAFSNRFFYQFLGLAGDIDSYKIPYVALSAFGVFLISLFAYEATGSYFGALIAGLSMATYPIFWAGSHFSFKDSEQAVFYLGAVWAFWHWLKDERHWWRGLVIFDIFIALALGTKWNILFLPITLLPWLFFIRKTTEFRRWFHFKKLLVAIPLSTIAVFAFVVVIWPYAWHDPIGTIWGVFNYYRSIGFGQDIYKPDGFDSFFGIDLYPITLFLTQAPLIILTLALIGGVAVILAKQKDDLKIGSLAILWIIVPLVRTIAPNFQIYGGMRQVKEFIPAMAMLAAFGGITLVTVFGKRFSLTGKILVLMCFVFLVIILYRLHPNENVYFNFLAGGTKGAMEKSLIDRTITYGNIYKQAATWLSANAEKNARVATLSGPAFALSPLWLRNDISISPNFFSDFDRKGEYIIAPYSALDLPVFGRRYLFKFLKPIHTIDVDGAPILFFFKNGPEYLKKEFSRDEETNDFEVTWVASPIRDYLLVNLKKSLAITKIKLKNVDQNCTAPAYQFIDEYIFFYPRTVVNGVDQSVFALNERRYLGDGKAEILFPGESARQIKIIPQSSVSCFIKGKIVSVSYLKDQ